MANKKPFSLMPKSSQCCDVRAGDSVSVSGDVLRMQLATLPAGTGQSCPVSGSQPGRHQGLPVTGGLCAPCSSWGCIQGRECRRGTDLWQVWNKAEGLCPFQKEGGAGSQVLPSWAVWEGDGTCCPSCSREGWELPDVITSFSSSPTSLCTYHYDDLFC